MAKAKVDGIVQSKEITLAELSKVHAEEFPTEAIALTTLNTEHTYMFRLERILGADADVESDCSAPRKLDSCIMEGQVQSEGALS